MNRLRITIILLLLPFWGVATVLGDEGTGDLEWSISVDGTLTIGSGTIDCSAGVPWSQDAGRIFKVVMQSGVVAKNCNGMFAYCTNLVDLDMSGLNTGSIESSDNMFGNTTPGMIKFPAEYRGSFPLDTQYRKIVDQNPLNVSDFSISRYIGLAISQRDASTFVLVKGVEQTLTVSSVGLSTLCYPNAVNFYGEEGPKDFRAFMATGLEESGNANEWYLVLQEIDNSSETSSIPANTPVIIYKPGGGDIVLGQAEDVSMAPVPVKTEGNLLVGANNRFRINNGNYFVLQNGTKGVAFYQINPNGEKPITMNQYRCYLDLTGVNAKSNSFSLVIPDELTGVGQIQISGAQKARQGLFDLNGRPVVNPQKGRVYIMNGCKVLIK